MKYFNIELHQEIESGTIVDNPYYGIHFIDDRNRTLILADLNHGGEFTWSISFYYDYRFLLDHFKSMYGDDVVMGDEQNIIDKIIYFLNKMEKIKIFL